MSNSLPPIRVAAIGLDHGHIFGMAHSVVAAGAELVSFFPSTGGLAEIFAKAHPDARAVADPREILEDDTIQLVLCAAVNADRAAIGLDVMRHGKDFMSDKPGVTTLEQLAEVRRVQADTGRIYSICFSERFENQATVRASELVSEGAIGRVLQTVGLGPHRMNAPTRPEWYFRRARYGGILCDIASHQMDQFLHFTGASEARVVASRIANHAHPQYPELEDFGEVLLEGDGCSGYVRVDWFTPDGLSSWGDGRLTLLGSEGFIEVRKNIDLAGRADGSHLFLVDGDQTRHIDCSQVALPYGRQLLEDVLNRSETAMTQVHCFLACELALQAQAQAGVLPPRNQEDAR
ncbi:MAG: Gfo/Idh/MocA family oxidoreductase [bacterium]|nr:Gfo/Idh/MocA family oxidoreductase [bacterium]